MKRCAAFIIVVLVLWATPALCVESSILVMDMAGGKATMASGPMAGTELSPMDFLLPEDSVTVPKGVRLVLNYLDSGLREEIIGPAVLTVGKTQSALTQGAPGQLKRESLDYMPDKAKVALAEAQNFGNVAFRDVSTAKSPPAIRILSLMNTAVMPGTRPSLRFLPVDGAESYLVVMKDNSGATLQNVPLDQGPYSPDPSYLTPGRQLAWTLTALKGGQPLAEAQGKFSVLAKDSAAALKTETARLKAKRKAESTEGQVFLSLLYQGYGLNDDAAEVLLALAKKNPDNLAITRRLEALNPALVPKP